MPTLSGIEIGLRFSHKPTLSTFLSNNPLLFQWNNLRQLILTIQTWHSNLLQNNTIHINKLQHSFTINPATNNNHIQTSKPKCTKPKSTFTRISSRKRSFSKDVKVYKKSGNSQKKTLQAIKRKMLKITDWILIFKLKKVFQRLKLIGRSNVHRES